MTSNIEQLSDHQHLIAEDGKSRSFGVLALLAIGAGAGILGLQSCEGSSETHNVTVQEQEVIALEGSFDTKLLTPVVRSKIVLDVHWDSPDLHIPLTPFSPGPPDTNSTYRADVPGDYDLSVPGIIATINRVSESESIEQPTSVRATGAEQSENPFDSKLFNRGKVDMDTLIAQAEDKIVVTIDRSQLFQDRIRVDSSLDDVSFVVENGKVIERDGEKVEPAEVIFAEDGQYILEKADRTGQDSALADLYEGISLGNMDIGEDALDTLDAAAQIATGNPACLEAISKQISLDEAVERSVRETLKDVNGFTDEQIEVRFAEGSDWPDPEDIKDEKGQTFAERSEEFENKVPGGMSISFESECKATKVIG